jgi:hypothetical protein
VSIFGDLERLLADLYPYRVPITLAAAAAIAVAATLIVRRGWHRPVVSWANRNRLAAGAASLLTVAVLVVVGDYLLSPLWERSTLVEASPLDVAATRTVTEQSSTTPGASPTGSVTPVSGASTATPPAATAAPTEAAGGASESSARLVKQGPFSGADDFHFASGQALIIETAPGAYTLRFEDFSIRNGPDLYVYLSSDPDEPTSNGVRLGRLKATDGAFNYEIPANVDPANLGYALVWCDQFAVRFATAPLEG